MSRPLLLLSGILLTFATAWLGLVLFPYLQLHDLHAAPTDGNAALIAAGRQVYVAEGCVYCHSQQVRGGHYNADLRRGWGRRRSVPADYAADAPELLGTTRTGPDLANVGARLTDPGWHLRHLYAPPLASPGSIMPPHPFLFEQRPRGGAPSPAALDFEPPHQPPPGYEILPTPRAKALVAYLLSLKRDEPVPDQ